MSSIERLPQEPAWWRDPGEEATIKRRDALVAFRVEELEAATSELAELVETEPTDTQALAELIAQQWSVSYLTMLGRGQSTYFPTGEQTKQAVAAGQQTADEALRYARKLPKQVLRAAFKLAHQATAQDE